MLKKLRACGGDFARKNHYGETALDAARSGKHAEAIEFLEKAMAENRANKNCVEFSSATIEITAACEHLKLLFGSTIGKKGAEAMAARLAEILQKRFALQWFPE